MQNVRIAGTAGNVDEVVTLKGFDNKPMVDVAGSSVRWDELHKNGVYTPNALHNFRFALAYWSDADGGNDPDLVSARNAGLMGTLRIGTAVATAAHMNSTLTREDANGFICSAHAQMQPFTPLSPVYTYSYVVHVQPS